MDVHHQEVQNDDPRPQLVFFLGVQEEIGVESHLSDADTEFESWVPGTRWFEKVTRELGEQQDWWDAGVRQRKGVKNREESA